MALTLFGRNYEMMEPQRANSALGQFIGGDASGAEAFGYNPTASMPTVMAPTGPTTGNATATSFDQRFSAQKGDATSALPSKPLEQPTGFATPGTTWGPSDFGGNRTLYMDETKHGVPIQQRAGLNDRVDGAINVAAGNAAMQADPMMQNMLELSKALLSAQQDYNTYGNWKHYDQMKLLSEALAPMVSGYYKPGELANKGRELDIESQKVAGMIPLWQGQAAQASALGRLADAEALGNPEYIAGKIAIAGQKALLDQEKAKTEAKGKVAASDPLLLDSTPEGAKRRRAFDEWISVSPQAPSVMNNPALPSTESRVPRAVWEAALARHGGDVSAAKRWLMSMDKTSRQALAGVRG